MRKERVMNVICRKKNGVLEYWIIAHSAVNPADFLGDLVNKNEFGALLLGNDGPSLLKEEESQRLVEGMKKEGIEASVRSGFIWVGHNECLKLHQRGWFALIGDALLLKRQPPGEDFQCNRLPKLSGFFKDKISSKDAALLEAILSDDDVYIYDDFRESFIVTKAPGVLDTILEQIIRIRT